MSQPVFESKPENEWLTDDELAVWLNLPIGTIQSQRHYKHGWLRRCAVKFGARNIRYHRPTVERELASRLEDPAR